MQKYKLINEIDETDCINFQVQDDEDPYSVALTQLGWYMDVEQPHLLTHVIPVALEQMGWYLEATDSKISINTTCKNTN